MTLSKNRVGLLADGQEVKASNPLPTSSVTAGAAVSSTNPLPVMPVSIVSTVNSTSATLAGGATFTGTGELNSYPDVMITLKSNVAGTLYIDLSIDGGANYDATLTYAVAANTGEFHISVKGNRTCRVRYTNGASAQSYFRLSTQFGTFRQANQSINTTLQNDADAAAVRPSHYQYEAALGRRAGVTTWNNFGYNADVDIGTEVVANFGGTFSPLAAASTLTFTCSSNSDIDGGTGAHGVVVYGIDASWNSQIEVVMLSGTTPVVTTSTWLGINRAAIYLAGSGKANAGTITITATTGGATQGLIATGEGTTQNVIFFVRDNYQALIDFVFLNTEKLSGGSTPKVTFKIWVFSAVSNARYEVFRYLIDTSAGDGHLDLSMPQPLVVGEKSAVWVEATTDTNDTSCKARFSLVEVAD